MNKQTIQFCNRPVRAVIFDMDGTLVANRDFHLMAWRQLCAEVGYSITDQELLSFFGCTNREIFAKLSGGNLNADQMEALANRKESLYRESYAGRVVPVDGLTDFLFALKSLGLPLALATSAPVENVSFTLEQGKLGHWFDVVVDATHVEFGKPNPEIFIKAAHRLGVVPGNCLVFEDAPHGIEAALAAGMGCIALTTTFPSSALPYPVPFIPNYTHLVVSEGILEVK
jgi:beta-phosphoglucomutase family hydrolase